MQRTITIEGKRSEEICEARISTDGGTCAVYGCRGSGIELRLGGTHRVTILAFCVRHARQISASLASTLDAMNGEVK